MPLKPPHLARLVACLHALGVVAFGTTVLAVPLLIRGVASLDAQVAPHGSVLELSGVLKDESGQPIDATVQVRVIPHPGGAPEPLPPAQLCAPAPGARIRVAPTRYQITPDSSGAFCIQMAGKALVGLAELTFAGNRFYSSASTTLAIDASRRSLSLRLSPEPRILALERPLHSIWVETHVDPPGDHDELAEAVQLKLSFSGVGGTPTQLGTTTVRAGERGLFTVKSRNLGMPGPGMLCVVFAGSPTLQPARRCTRVERTAHVVLSVAGRVEPADPQSGVHVRVAVGSALGAVPEGSVEALVGGDSVGTAPVTAGAAEIVAQFEAPHGGTIPMTLRYLPDAPWWEPARALRISVPVTAPSPWRRWPWAAAALLIAVYLIQGWRRPARGRPRNRTRSSTLPPGRPSLEVVAQGPARSGWHGVVLDAHDGLPVGDAEVQVLLPSFDGEGVAQPTRTDASGHFKLTYVDGVEGARLRVSARWHSPLVKPLPPAGELTISLVSRRRSLLERLVSWAARRGYPWYEGSEPTPGAVARVAERYQAPSVRDWAEAVQRAAYGPAPPSEDDESWIVAKEPDDPPRSNLS